MPSTKIWPDTIKQETCTASRCGRAIWFAVNARTGKRGPFDSRPVPVAEERELETHRPIWVIDLHQTISHFATCPARTQFRRPTGRR